MKGFTSFQFYHNSKAETLDVLLHGGSVEGIKMSLMQKVFKLSMSQDHGVITFNFPFAERGMEQSSGLELTEELKTLQRFLEYCHEEDYKKVRLIGKSLGAIVASFYLDRLPESKSGRFSVVILGYVTGSLRLKNFIGPITIIQGEKDKFGSIEAVKQDLKDAKSPDVKFFEVPNADHSYRDPETKEPIYEDEAIRILSNI